MIEMLGHTANAGFELGASTHRVHFGTEVSGPCEDAIKATRGAGSRVARPRPPIVVEG